MPIDGNCSYEVNHLKNLANVSNFYGKKTSEMVTMNNMRPVRQVMGRPERDVKSLLGDSVERNTTLFKSQLDGDDAKSLLRQKSISSMLKNKNPRGLPKRSQQDSAYQQSRAEKL